MTTVTIIIEGKTVKRRPDMDTWNYRPEDEDDEKYTKKYVQQVHRQV
jgi:hypothetical protein